MRIAKQNTILFGPDLHWEFLVVSLPLGNGGRQVKKRRKSGTKLKCTMLNQWARSKSEINEKEEVLYKVEKVKEGTKCHLRWM